MTASRPVPAARWWSRRAPLLALALLPLALACDASARLGGPATGFSGGSSQFADLDPALVGTWRRTLLLGGAGELLRTETIWTFRGDGTATRFIEIIDFGRGRASRFVSHARWEVIGRTLLIDWRPPMSGTLRLEYRVALGGETAILGDDPYERVH